MPLQLRQTGRIVDWNDARGFGFISTPELRDRVWVHVKDFTGNASRPMVGDEVAFVVTEGRDGRPAAKYAQITSSAAPRARPANDAPTPLRIAVRIGAALFLSGFVLTAAVMQRVPVFVPLVYLGMGLVSAILYRLDKQAALRGEWRTPELRLHAADLGFGIVGGLIAQAVFRHKSSKLGFTVVTALIFAIHLAGLGMLLGLFG